MKSIREIAEEIADKVFISGLSRVATRDIIKQALRDRDERAAKIVNNARTEGADLRELVARIRDDKL